jgi:hypothetical protein
MGGAPDTCVNPRRYLAAAWVRSAIITRGWQKPRSRIELSTPVWWHSLRCLHSELDWVPADSIPGSCSLVPGCRLSIVLFQASTGYSLIATTVFIVAFVAAPPVDIDGIPESVSGSLIYGNNIISTLFGKRQALTSGSSTVVLTS